MPRPHATPAFTVCGAARLDSALRFLLPLTPFSLTVHHASSIMDARLPSFTHACCTPSAANRMQLLAGAVPDLTADHEAGCMHACSGVHPLAGAGVAVAVAVKRAA